MEACVRHLIKKKIIIIVTFYHTIACYKVRIARYKVRIARYRLKSQL